MINTHFSGSFTIDTASFKQVQPDPDAPGRRPWQDVSSKASAQKLNAKADQHIREIEEAVGPFLDRINDRNFPLDVEYSRRSASQDVVSFTDSRRPDMNLTVARKEQESFADHIKRAWDQCQIWLYGDHRDLEKN